MNALRIAAQSVAALIDACEKYRAVARRTSTVRTYGNDVASSLPTAEEAPMDKDDNNIPTECEALIFAEKAIVNGNYFPHGREPHLTVIRRMMHARLPDSEGDCTCESGKSFPPHHRADCEVFVRWERVRQHLTHQHSFVEMHDDQGNYRECACGAIRRRRRGSAVYDEDIRNHGLHQLESDRAQEINDALAEMRRSLQVQQNRIGDIEAFLIHKYGPDWADGWDAFLAQRLDRR